LDLKSTIGEARLQMFRGSEGAADVAETAIDKLMAIWNNLLIDWHICESEAQL